MTDPVADIDARILAEGTRRCRDAIQVELTNCFLAERRAGRPGQYLAPTAQLRRTYDAYEQALGRELAQTAALPPRVHPQPAAHSLAARTRLALRGGARLAAGIPLGTLWAVLGPCICPESARDHLRHFALHTCCAGAVSDFKRVNTTQSTGLASKRAYQLRQAEQAGYMAGRFGPLTEPAQVAFEARPPVDVKGKAAVLPGPA